MSDAQKEAYKAKHGRGDPRHQRKRGEDHRAADRRCLTCQKVFRSHWEGNRICDLCKLGVNEGQGGLGEYPLHLGRGNP